MPSERIIRCVLRRVDYADGRADLWIDGHCASFANKAHRDAVAAILARVEAAPPPCTCVVSTATGGVNADGCPRHTQSGETKGWSPPEAAPSGERDTIIDDAALAKDWVGRSGDTPASVPTTSGGVQAPVSEAGDAPAASCPACQAAVKMADAIRALASMDRIPAPTAVAWFNKFDRTIEPSVAHAPDCPNMEAPRD